MEPIKLMPMTASFEIVIVGHNNLRTSQAECKLPGIQGRTWRGMIHRYHRIAHFVWLQSAALCRTPAEHEAFMTDIGCYALLLSHQSAWPHRFFSHHRTTSKWLLAVYWRNSGASKYSPSFFYSTFSYFVNRQKRVLNVSKLKNLRLNHCDTHGNTDK